LLERANHEKPRRTYVVHVVPNEESRPRFVRAPRAEVHENWIENNRYIYLSLLKELKEEPLWTAARLDSLRPDQFAQRDVHSHSVTSANACIR